MSAGVGAALIITGVVIKFRKNLPLFVFLLTYLLFSPHPQFPIISHIIFSAQPKISHLSPLLHMRFVSNKLMEIIRGSGAENWRIMGSNLKALHNVIHTYHIAKKDEAGERD